MLIQDFYLQVLRGWIHSLSHFTKPELVCLEGLCFEVLPPHLQLSRSFTGANGGKHKINQPAVGAFTSVPSQHYRETSPSGEFS